MEPTGIEPATPSLQSYSGGGASDGNAKTYENDARRGAQDGAQEAAKSTPATLPTDPDFLALAGTWPRLPGAVRAALLAMAQAAALAR